MPVTQDLSPKAKRKLARKIRNEVLAKEARFWRNAPSAERLGYSRPVNRQAAKELSFGARKKRDKRSTRGIK
jgi:DNA-binding FadR family transcriptional regulator